jgi:hypothetical protein
MRKILFLIPFSLFLNAAVAAVPWWQQPTICKSNPANCYAGMGAGFDDGMWDAVSNCWGMKMICPQALTAGGTDPVPKGKSAIAAGTGIKADFDTDILNSDCFGSRRTAANGSMASVNGSYVNVWCGGVLNNADEVLQTGEIMLGAQPTCKELAQNGWVAVLNQRCYGKYYDSSNYYVECAGSNMLPSRLIELNGASAVIGTSAGNYNYPTDVGAAKSLFDEMHATSASQKSKYFN